MHQAMRATAWAIVAAGVAAPLLRKRVPAPPAAMQALAFAAPVGLAVAVPRSRRRDVAVEPGLVCGRGGGDEGTADACHNCFNNARCLRHLLHSIAC